MLLAISILVALLSGSASAASPLDLASVHRMQIGELATDFTMAGWAFTRDGRHVYVAGGDVANTTGLVAHLTVDGTSGALAFADAVRDPFGLPVVFGGLGGAMQLGPDEAELYYASLGLLAVFRRDPMSGALTLLQSLEFPGFGSDAVAVAPDGRHVLVAANDSIALYPRATDGTLGAPVLVPTVDRDAGDRYTSPQVVGLAISGDGRSVYALEAEGEDGNRDAVLILRRDPATGALDRIQRVGDGFDDWVSLGSLSGLAASRDGRDLLVGSDVYGQGEIVSLRLAAGGDLAVRARVVGRSVPSSEVVDVSPDGGLVLSGGQSALRVWVRDPESGDLALVQVLQDGQDGVEDLDGVDSIVTSPDGRYVHVLATQDHAVTVLRRRCGDGVVDASEGCDDGNFVSHDGCDAACRVEPCWQCAGGPSVCSPIMGSCDDGDACTTGDSCTAGRCTGTAAADGASCSDGNPCTTGDSCRAGACTPTGRMSCGGCGLCDREVAACVGMVGRGCQRPPQTLTGGRHPVPERLPVGRFVPKRGASALRVRWKTDDPTALDGVGDPTAGTGYDVCLLDLSGFDDLFPYERQRRHVVAEAHVPSAGECKAGACWRRSHETALVYHRRNGKPDGVRRLRFTPNTDGGLDLALDAGGRAFRLGRRTRLAGPVTVQIIADGGACWQGDVNVPKASRARR
jgi:cysteine-rich repeat protein